MSAAARVSTMARSVQRALLVGIAIGAASGLLLALWTAALNEWLLSADTVVLALHLAALYGLVTALPLMGVALVAAGAGRPPSRRQLAAGALAAYLVLGGMQRFIRAGQFLTPTSHMSLLGLMDLALLLLASGFTYWGLTSPRRRALALGATAVCLVLGVLFAANAAHDRPLQRDLGRVVPDALGHPQTARRARTDLARPLPEARLVLIGFDGLSFEPILPMLREGLLPGFATLLEGAAYGYLQTFPDAYVGSSRYSRLTSAETLTPVVWETINTGQPPDRHGVGGHSYYTFAGVDRLVRHLPTHYRGNSPLALKRLLDTTRSVAPWELGIFDATHGRVARFWEVAMEHGYSTGSFLWRNTGPAAPVRGFQVGFGAARPRAHPPDLLDQFQKFRAGRDMREGDMATLHERDERERLLFERFMILAQQVPTDLLLFYTHYPDAVNHHNWRWETAGGSFLISGLSHPENVPGEFSRTALVFLDDVVATLLASVPEDAIVVLLSDHGFDWREYKHHNGVPGVFIARGPGIRPGPIAEASVYDVAPTLLHWLGLPVADDMDGAPLEIVLRGGPLDRPVTRVASYGAAMPVAVGGVDAEDLEAQEAELRALGYID